MTAFVYPATVALALLMAWGAADPPTTANMSVATVEALKVSESLNLAALEQMALENNPTFAQAQAVVEAQLGMARQAGLIPNPNIGYVGDQINAQGSAGEMQGGFVQQTIILGGKLKLSREKYTQRARIAELQALAQRYRIVNGVRIAYFHVLGAQAMIDVRRDLLKNADDAVQTVREMINVGQASRADLLQAQVQARRQAIALRNAEYDLQLAWQMLVTQVGRPDLPQTTLAGELESDAPDLEWGKSLARLLEESPELLIAYGDLRHDQITLQRERAQPIPNVSLQANTGRNFETSNSVAGVSASINVPLFNRNQGTIRQVQAELSRSHAEIRRRELALQRKLAKAFNKYQASLLSAREYRNAVLPESKQAFDMLLKSYQERRAPWPDVLVAEKSYFELREDYIHRLVELREAEVAIDGLVLVDGLDEPAGPMPGGHLDATPDPR